jgi:hypothetical protein
LSTRCKTRLVAAFLILTLKKSDLSQPFDFDFIEKQLAAALMSLGV